MKTCDIVVGLGFGDEGKGKTTDWLCSLSPKSTDSIVIRYSGGHQAGHTVEISGRRHVFQSFGSGTLRGVPTFWSRFCTFYPIGFIREYQELAKIGVTPEIYVDPLTPVTTVYDVMYNQMIAEVTGHGSVGVGFGCTIERHETPCKLYVKDLFYESIYRAKLRSIMEYYRNKLTVSLERRWLSQDFATALSNFVDAVSVITTPSFNGGKIIMADERQIIQRHDHVVFEGAQGVLLDMDHGFFPYVTRSNTTSRNAIEMLTRTYGHSMPCIPTVYYVTRSYLTRHGAGPFPTENNVGMLKNINDNTNKFNDWQKHLRVGCLDMELLKYALTTDQAFSNMCHKQLCMTHIDCVDEADIPTSAGVYTKYELLSMLPVDAMMVSGTVQSEFEHI